MARPAEEFVLPEIDTGDYQCYNQKSTLLWKKGDGSTCRIRPMKCAVKKCLTKVVVGGPFCPRHTTQKLHLIFNTNATGGISVFAHARGGGLAFAANDVIFNNSPNPATPDIQPGTGGGRVYWAPPIQLGDDVRNGNECRQLLHNFIRVGVHEALSNCALQADGTIIATKDIKNGAELVFDPRGPGPVNTNAQIQSLDQGFVTKGSNRKVDLARLLNDPRRKRYRMGYIRDYCDEVYSDDEDSDEADDDKDDDGDDDDDDCGDSSSSDDSDDKDCDDDSDNDDDDSDSDGSGCSDDDDDSSGCSDDDDTMELDCILSGLGGGSGRTKKSAKGINAWLKKVGACGALGKSQRKVARKAKKALCKQKNMMKEAKSAMGLKKKGCW